VAGCSAVSEPDGYIIKQETSRRTRFALAEGSALLRAGGETKRSAEEVGKAEGGTKKTAPSNGKNNSACATDCPGESLNPASRHFDFELSEIQPFLPGQPTVMCPLATTPHVHQHRFVLGIATLEASVLIMSLGRLCCYTLREKSADLAAGSSKPTLDSLEAATWLGMGRATATCSSGIPLTLPILFLLSCIIDAANRQTGTEP
jgi:hypothetical protein